MVPDTGVLGTDSVACSDLWRMKSQKTALLVAASTFLPATSPRRNLSGLRRDRIAAIFLCLEFVVSGTCVIGLQWGDEAKGKLVDLLAPQFDIVVRYQGGANAGHTVVAGAETYKLHHIPSGILHKHVQNLITPGVVINPSTMLDEIDGLAARGVICEHNMRISERAHLVMPWHIAEDKFINAAAVRGESIGTTNRGIGPCYRDKVGRTHAIRMADLVVNTRDERIGTIAEQKVNLLGKMGASQEDLDSIAPETVIALAAGWTDRLQGMIGDTTDFLLDACEADKKILFEGAQARCWISTTAPFHLSPVAIAVVLVSAPEPVYRLAGSTKFWVFAKPTARESEAVRSSRNWKTRLAIGFASLGTNTEQRPAGQGGVDGSTRLPFDTRRG